MTTIQPATTGVEKTLNRKWKSRTIFVTDIEDFTGFKTEHGSDLADNVLEEHDRIVLEQVKRFGGHVLKSTGDGFLCWFENEDSAVIAAVRTQQALYERSLTVKLSQEQIPPVKIAINSGRVTERQRANQPDMVGATVDKAFRICTATNGNHIIVQGDDPQDLITNLKNNYQDKSIFEDVQVQRRGELLWKGGRENATSIMEVAYKRRGDFIPAQTEFLLGPDLVYDKSKAINMALEMVSSAKERLLIALRTLPVLTGPNVKQVPKDAAADAALESALKGRLSGIANSNDPIREVTLVYSLADSRKYVQRARVPFSSLKERVDYLKDVKNHAGSHFTLLRARTLETAMLISDKKVAIWVIYEGKGIAAKGFGLRIVSPDVSAKLWDHVYDMCDPEERDYDNYSADFGPNK